MWQSQNRWLLLALASGVTPLAEVVEHWTGMQETRVLILTEARFVSVTFGAHVGTWLNNPHHPPPGPGVVEWNKLCVVVCR